MRDRFLILFFFFIYVIPCQASELVIVQSVSTTKRTFAIRRGNAHGVTLNQKALFSNEELNIIAKCTDVTRLFSVWEPVSKEAIVPFLKGEFISYNKKTDDLGLDIIRFSKRPEIKILKEKPYWVAKLGLVHTFSGTVSSTAPDSEERRAGIQAEGYYKKKFYREFSWEVGIRYDYEVIRLTRPVLDIPVNRYLAMGGITYRFSELSSQGNHIYTGLSFGLGYSRSLINSNVVLKGFSTVLPMIKMGYHLSMDTYSMLFEIGVESLSSTGKLDSGVDQSTKLLNGKLTIGIQF